MMPYADGIDRRLDALSSLGDSVRRRLYRWVLDASAPVCRDEVAAATGVTRSMAGYHLDKLADAGLLRVRFERRTGRTGPGAGRPAKLYGRPADAVTVSLPPRAYELLARLLARAVEGGGVDAAARGLGAEIAAGAIAGGDGAGPLPALTRIGFEPYDDDGVVRLRNCPFARVAREHRDLVCGANLALVEGVLAALDGRAGGRASVLDGRAGGRAGFEPGPDRCCVAVHPA